tara:strand:+ start:1398 stop:2690 length:1293 start_codon:yes stop_codon:yes gene_type:complete
MTKRLLEKSIDKNDQLTPDTLIWVEKIRRFASYNGRHLRKRADERFGSQSPDELFWMFRFLVSSMSKHPTKLLNSVDGATLSAALYLKDSISSQNIELQKKLKECLNNYLYCLEIHSINNLKSTEIDGPQFQPLNKKLLLEESSTAKSIIIFSPNPYSLYSRSVLRLCQLINMPISGIVLRSMSFSRFKSEWNRDGTRLVRKIWRKLILKEDEYKERSNLNVKTVVEKLNTPTNDIRSMAKAMKIPCISVPELIDSIKFIDHRDPQIGLFTGGGIMPQEIVNLFSIGVINVHMGHLPRYKGMDVAHAPIMEGKDENIGLTSHLMDKSIDTGPIIQNLNLGYISSFNGIGEIRNALSCFMPFVSVDSACGLVGGRLVAQPQQTPGRMHYYIHPKLKKLVESSVAKRQKHNDSGANDYLNLLLQESINSYMS